MTRKQALTIILAYFDNIDLSNDIKLKRAVEILGGMKDGTPGKIWDKNSVEKALERFKKEYGRYPKVKELDSCEYLPAHPVISNIYKMTAGEWLNSNYPDYKETNAAWKYQYGFLSKEDLKQLFIEQFTAINPSSAEQYNSQRKRRTPSWQFVARELGVSTWNELKALCNVGYYNPVEDYSNYTVVSTINGIDI